MFDPPPGFDDLLGDAELGTFSGRFDYLDVPKVGLVKARRPMPNAMAALSMAANSQIGVESRTDYLVLFVRNHLGEGELERIYHSMITGDTPADSMERIARAVATWGTARPTLPSSHCV